MKKYVLLFLISFISVSYSQPKYLIYFKDKGISKTSALNKNISIYKEAVNSLSERSIERRKKTMGENFISFEDLPIKKDYLAELTNAGIKVEKKLKWFNAVSAYLNEEQKSKLLSFPFIMKVEPVKVLTYKRDEGEAPAPLKMETGDTDFDYGASFAQDNLIAVPKVQAKGITGEGVIVGLLDSGFRWKVHEALMNRKVIAEYDFVQNDRVTANQPGDVSNQDEHGTGVFSIIGGFKDGIIVGPAFGASYILAKTEDIGSETHVEEDNYASALIWMDSIGADLTSSSLGYSEFDNTTYSYTYADMNGNTTIVTKAAELAFQRGILTITAAGNEGNNAWHYIVAPSDGFNTIAVGAVNSQNVIASFSSRGPSSDGRIKPDIVAQGVAVFHATPSISSYGIGDGTSYATPLAAGAAALLLSANPYLNNVQARDILLRTAGSFTSPDTVRGYGLVSAAKAISYPNIEQSGTGYNLHKIFINESGINPSTVIVNIFPDGSDTAKLNLNYDGTLKYVTALPVYSAGTKIDFYFTYSDSAGSSFRDPAAINYSFIYGSNIITGVENETETPAVPQDFVLAQNYPNPFNNGTIIKFNADINTPARLVIYNSLGEIVKVLFDGITDKKENSIFWNGITSSGEQSASGIYFYTLIFNGKYYSKKMVYLK